MLIFIYLQTCFGLICLNLANTYKETPWPAKTDGKMTVLMFGDDCKIVVSYFYFRLIIYNDSILIFVFWAMTPSITMQLLVPFGRTLSHRQALPSSEFHYRFVMLSVSMLSVLILIISMLSGNSEYL